MAAENGHIGVVRLLKSRSAIYTDYPCGDTICLAAARRYQDIVQLVLDSEVWYGGAETLKIALVGAAQYGETNMVQFLINQGVKLDQRGCGHHVLKLAAERGFDDMVRLLAEHGVPVTDNEFTGEPMLYSLVYGQNIWWNY